MPWEGAADLVQPTVVTNGFLKDSSLFKGADAVVIYSDGGGPALQGNNLELLSKLMDKGTGLSPSITPWSPPPLRATRNSPPGRAAFRDALVGEPALGC